MSERKRRRANIQWWVISTFSLLIAVFTFVVWRAQKSGGSCYQQPPSQETASPTSNSPTVQAVPDEKTPPNQTQKATTDAQSYFCRLITPTNLPTDYLVIIGIGGVWAALQTLSAIKRQADLMERQTVTAENAAKSDERAIRLTERADILLEGCSINNPVQGCFDSHSQPRFQFKNFGRTRANNVVFDVRLLIPDVPDVKSRIPADVAMAANAHQVISFTPFGSFLTEATFRDICEGKSVIRFVGDVSYEDVFGDKHRAECAGEFNADLRTGSVPIPVENLKAYSPEKA